MQMATQTLRHFRKRCPARSVVLRRHHNACHARVCGKMCTITFYLSLPLFSVHIITIGCSGSRVSSKSATRSIYKGVLILILCSHQQKRQYRHNHSRTVHHLEHQAQPSRPPQDSRQCLKQHRRTPAPQHPHSRAAPRHYHLRSLSCPSTRPASRHPAQASSRTASTVYPQALRPTCSGLCRRHPRSHSKHRRHGRTRSQVRYLTWWRPSRT